MKYGVISGSLNPQSKGNQLAIKAFEYAQKKEMDVTFIEMRDYADLPHCDGEACYHFPKVKQLHDLLYPIDGFLYCFPVYNYTGNGFMKTLLELLGNKKETLGLTGKVFTHKVVGLCAMAGSSMSFLSPFFITHSLIADFQTIVVPKYVLASYDDLKEGVFSDPLVKRVETLVDNVKLFTESNQHYIEKGRHL